LRDEKSKKTGMSRDESGSIVHLYMQACCEPIAAVEVKK
jgi:hypothetical protein